MAFSIGEICLGGTAEDVRHLLAISLINPVPENHILVSRGGQNPPPYPLLNHFYITKGQLEI